MKEIGYYVMNCVAGFIVGGVIGLFLLSIIGVSGLFAKELNDDNHLTNSQLSVALRDLAEFGICYVSSEVHAWDISRAVPITTKIVKIDKHNTWRIEEVKNNA